MSSLRIPSSAHHLTMVSPILSARLVVRHQVETSLQHLRIALAVWTSQLEELEVEGEQVQVPLSEEEEVVAVAVAVVEEAPSLKYCRLHKTRDFCSAFRLL